MISDCENSSPKAELPLPMRPPVVSSELGPKVAADYEALRNDLEQAQEIAAEFQRQVAGKSNEVATMRQLLEKTTIDLQKMEASIAQIRKERHDLGNRVMVGAAYEVKFNRATSECERLRREAEALHAAVGAAREEGDGEIRRLGLENSRLLTEIERLKLHGGGEAAPSGSVSSDAMLARILATVEDVRDTVNRLPGRPGASEYIDITFEG